MAKGRGFESHYFIRHKGRVSAVFLSDSIKYRQMGRRLHGLTKRNLMTLPYFRFICMTMIEVARKLDKQFLHYAFNVFCKCDFNTACVFQCMVKKVCGGEAGLKPAVKHA